VIRSGKVTPLKLKAIEGAIEGVVEGDIERAAEDGVEKQFEKQLSIRAVAAFIATIYQRRI